MYVLLKLNIFLIYLLLYYSILALLHLSSSVSLSLSQYHGEAIAFALPETVESGGPLQSATLPGGNGVLGAVA